VLGGDDGRADLAAAPGAVGGDVVAGLGLGDGEDVAVLLDMQAPPLACRSRLQLLVA